VIALALTLDDLLFLHEESALPRTAIAAREGHVSYGELIARVEVLSRRLWALGVRRGDRVVVHLAKSSEEIAAMFACWRVGAVAVNVNVQWTLAQLRYVVDDAGARVLLCDARRAAELGASGQHPLERVIVKGECPAYSGFEGWPSGSDERFAKPRVLDCDLAAILYTSGSTGAPKGVMLTHLNLLLGARSVARYLGMRPDERVLSLLPLSFDYGLNQLLTSFMLGATLVLAPIAMPSEVVKILVSEKVTAFAAVPPVWVQVVRYLESVKTELPALRYVTNSGGKIPEPTLRAMPGVFPGVQIFLMYGLTEAFRSTYLLPDRFHEKMGSMGRAIPNVEVFVVVKGRGPAGPGEEGELVHRGSLISAGYWNKPEATAEKIRVCPELVPQLGDEKVVYSGDAVRVDADGDLWFVGRTDTMIKSMGFRLAPTEVEEILHKSGLVHEAVAFGVDDELAGQVVHVCVAAGSAVVDVDALMAHCRAHMPHYMLPRRIHTWPSDMPRTASGKIDVPTVVRTIKNEILTPSGSSQ
jgi:acyl-CoA synthetase (AMP-forming)/AMP-acid ligase II